MSPKGATEATARIDSNGRRTDDNNFNFSELEHLVERIKRAAQQMACEEGDKGGDDAANAQLSNDIRCFSNLFHQSRLLLEERE